MIETGGRHEAAHALVISKTSYGRDAAKTSSCKRTPHQSRNGEKFLKLLDTTVRRWNERAVTDSSTVPQTYSNLSTLAKGVWHQRSILSAQNTPKKNRKEPGDVLWHLPRADEKLDKKQALDDVQSVVLKDNKRGIRDNVEAVWAKLFV